MYGEEEKKRDRIVGDMLCNTWTFNALVVYRLMELANLQLFVRVLQNDLNTMCVRVNVLG